METWNKIVEYRDYKINISVTLNAEVEKRPNGRVFHTLVCTTLNSWNYYTKDKFEDFLLEQRIEFHLREVTKAIDTRIDGEVPDKNKNLLIKLGFQKQ